MKGKIRDIAAGVAFILIAAAFYFERDLSYPAYVFPYAVELLIVLCSVILIIRTVVKKRPESAAPEQEQTHPRNRKQVLVIIIGSLVYLSLITLVGFYVVSFIYVMGIAIFLQPPEIPLSRKIISSSIMTVIILVIVFFMFGMLLRVPTPTGLLV